MTGLDLNLGLTALSLKVELLQAITRNIGGGPDGEVATATAAMSASRVEDAARAPDEERRPALPNVAAEPHARSAAGTLLGLRQPTAQAMRLALADEIARLMTSDEIAPSRHAGSSRPENADPAEPRPTDDRGAETAADEHGFEASLAKLVRRAVSDAGAPQPGSAPAARQPDAVAADQVSAPPVRDLSAAVPAGDAASAARPAYAAPPSVDASDVSAGRGAVEAVAIVFEDDRGEARFVGRRSALNASSAATREAPAPPVRSGGDRVSVEGVEPLPEPAAPALAVASPAVARAVLDGLAGEASLSAAFAASLGEGFDAMPQRGGVIASFILNAAMIPGWPPPRPIEPAALRAFVFDVVGDAKLTRDEAEMLLYLANLGIRAKDLRRLMRRILAAKNRSALMLALAAILTNARAALSALAEELAALAEELGEERRLAAGDGRSRLLLR